MILFFLDDTHITSPTLVHRFMKLPHIGSEEARMYQETSRGYENHLTLCRVSADGSKWLKG